MILDFKIGENGASGGSLLPGILLSLLSHSLFIFGLIALSMALYKSDVFERPQTFELVRLAVETAPSAPASSAKKQIERKKAPAPVKAAVQAQPRQAEPVREQQPMPSPEKKETGEKQVLESAPQAAVGQETGRPSEPGFSPNTIFDENAVDEKAVLLSKTKPFYPAFVKEQNIQGKVRIEAYIDQEGNVTDIKVVQSPHELLTEEVLKTIARWKYKPAKKSGIAVKVKRLIEFTFQIEND